MPKIISKPILYIYLDNNINYIDLNMYIDPTHVAQIISSPATLGEESLLKDWAYQHKVEFLKFKPNFEIWGTAAYQECVEEMIRFCDAVLIFWNGKTNINYIIEYIQKMDRIVLVHKIESRD